MNSSEIVTALRTHYGTSYALIEQVGDNTGFRANRHIDVVAMGLWPSRGLELHAIEVKVSRGDFMRELTNPAKAESISERCHRFFIAAPAGLIDPVQLASIAPRWGLFEIADERGRRVVKSTRPAERQDPKPLDLNFLAAILRRLPQPSEALRAEIEASERARLEEAFAQKLEHEVARRLGNLEETSRRAKAFESATGIQLATPSSYGWLEVEDVASAVGFLARQRGDGWQTFRAKLLSAATRLATEASSLTERETELRTIAELDFGVRDA